MQLSHRGRITSASLAVGALAVVALDAYLATTLRSQLRDNLAADLERDARILADGASSHGGADTPALRGALRELARRAGLAADARFTFVGRGGEVLADSRVEPAQLAGLENHASRPEVAAALSGRTGRGERESRTLGVEMLYVAVPVPSPTSLARVARVALPLTRVDAVVARARWLLYTASGVALLVALLGAVLTSRLLTRSLGELREVAVAMAAGDYRRRARVSGRDEIGALAAAMNGLAEALARSVGRVEEERDLLTAILDGLEEGVLVVGPDGRVLRGNPALGRALGLDGVAVGAPVLELVALPELAAAIESCLREGGVVRRELTLQRPSRTLLAAVAPLRAGRGAVAVFHDLSALRRLEAVRRDFVSNVSHELRTPVTALRAAAETLLHGALADPQKASTFLGVILRHAERMSRLVSDLLDLSRIESGQMELRSERVSLASSLEGALEVIDEEARRKGLAVDARIENLACRGDPRAVEQILVNLLDNAVKYTPEGGAVRVRGERCDGRARVTVEDTGPGIAAEHLPRVFERFYRVDPGRSRDVGGTGLGLAIVRHLTEAMGGAVRAESVVGEGSRFIVELPGA